MLSIGALVVGAFAIGAAVAYANTYYGTNGADTITVERSGSVAYLRGGNDTFEGARGREEDPGNDYGGGDHVYGGRHDDEISSHTYVDVLRGQRGDDILDGGAQADALHGGRGDDTLIGGAGRDLFKPGKGEDLCIGQRRDYGFPRNCERVRVVAP